MTIAAVPPPAIDVVRVSPSGEAPAPGFEELLTGAQQRDPSPEQCAEPCGEPRGEPARPRPVRPDQQAASESEDSPADEVADEAIETNGRSSADESAPAENGASGTAADPTPIGAPQVVVAPTLPDGGIGVIVLDAWATLEAASEVSVDAVIATPLGDVVASIATTPIETVPTTTPADDAAIAPSHAAPEPAPELAPARVDTAPLPLESKPTVRPDARSTARATDAGAPPAAPTPTTTENPSEPMTAGAPATDSASAPATIDDTGLSRPAARAVTPTPTATPTGAPEGAAVVAASPTTVTATGARADDTARPTPAAPAPTPITGREVAQFAFAPAVAANTVPPVGAATAPAVAEQVVAVLHPLRQVQDGSYRLRLELRPPELGRIELRVEMRDGVLSASLHTDNEGAAHTLRDALGDLRLRLEQDGVRAGALTVDGGRTGQRQHRNSPTARPDADATDSTESLARPAEATESDSLLDVRL